MYDLFITRDMYSQIKYSSGIYVLLSDEKIPLYVGKSVSLKSRVRGHLSGFGDKHIIEHVGKFHFVGIIYHEDDSTLDAKETEIINKLKPELNISKTNYPKVIDMSTINDRGILVPTKCKHYKTFFETCGSNANSNGYCSIHDPSYFSWIYKGKYITSEMQRLLYECKYKKDRLYFYMSKQTFRKLFAEKTYAEYDFENNETVLRFKKHFVILDDEETIRLEVIMKRE